MLVARLPGDHIAEAGFPDLAVERGRPQRRLGEPGLAQQIELIAAELLAAQFGRIDGMRIDQHRRYAGTPQHGRGGRSGQAFADDGNVRIAHALCLVVKPYQ